MKQLRIASAALCVTMAGCCKTTDVSAAGKSITNATMGYGTMDTGALEVFTVDAELHFSPSGGRMELKYWQDGHEYVVQWRFVGGLPPGS